MIKLDEMAIRAAEWASRDETRWNLTHVRIDPRGFIEAVDGHRLMRIELPEGSDEPKKPIHLPAGPLAAAFQTARAVSDSKKLVFEVNAKGVRHTTKAGVEISIPADPDVVFPDTDTVIPAKKSKPKLRVGINRRYLRDALALLDAVEAENIAIEIRGEIEPLIARGHADGREILLLIMPARI